MLSLFVLVSSLLGFEVVVLGCHLIHGVSKGVTWLQSTYLGCLERL